MMALRGTEAANSDFALALSFPPLDGRREVELVTGYTQPRAVVHHLGVPFLAMAGDPKDLVGEGDVVDENDAESGLVRDASRRGLR